MALLREFIVCYHSINNANEISLSMLSCYRKFFTRHTDVFIYSLTDLTYMQRRHFNIE